MPEAIRTGLGGIPRRGTASGAEQRAERRRLTPSVAALRRAKQETSLKIICMVRPRAAGFCYDEADVQIMMDDARILLQEGADGIGLRLSG